MTWRLRGRAALLRGDCVDLLPRLAAARGELAGRGWARAAAHFESVELVISWREGNGIAEHRAVARVDRWRWLGAERTRPVPSDHDLEREGGA